MTQPVYDPRSLERFLDDVAPLGLPVLVGLLPLASYRNAEFLHNEVPGMQVPEAVRERMRKAGSGAAARKEGVAIAREMLAAVRVARRGGVRDAAARALRARARGGRRVPGVDERQRDRDRVAARGDAIARVQALAGGAARGATLASATTAPAGTCRTPGSLRRDASSTRRSVDARATSGTGASSWSATRSRRQDGFAVGLVHAPATGAEALVARVVGHQVADEWVVAKRGELVADAPPPRAACASARVSTRRYRRADARADAGRRARAGSSLEEGGRGRGRSPTYLRARRRIAGLRRRALRRRRPGRARLGRGRARPAAGSTLAAVPLDGGRRARAASRLRRQRRPRRSARRAARGRRMVGRLDRASLGGRDGRGRAARSRLVEGPAEDRAYSWIEVVVVDDDGAPSGAPRRITPALGHVASFDLGAAVAAGSSTSSCVTRRRPAKGRGAASFTSSSAPTAAIDEPAVLVARRGRPRIGRPRHRRRASVVAVVRRRAGPHPAVPLGRPARRSGSPSIEDALDGGAAPRPRRAPDPSRASRRAFPGGDGAALPRRRPALASAAVRRFGREAPRRRFSRARTRPSSLAGRYRLRFPRVPTPPTFVGPPTTESTIRPRTRERTRAHSSIGQSPRLITGLFLVRTQVGPRRGRASRSSPSFCSSPARALSRAAVTIVEE